MITAEQARKMSEEFKIEDNLHYMIGIVEQLIITENKNHHTATFVNTRHFNDKIDKVVEFLEANGYTTSISGEMLIISWGEE